MIFIGPPAGLTGSGRSSAAARSRPQCRAGDFARRLGFAVWQGFRDDASIVPYECKARCCQTLRGIPAANRQCTPQSAVADSSPCRGAFPNGSHPQSRQNKYSPEHGGSGLYCFVPRPRSGGPYSEITEANGRRDKPTHGGKPGAEAPHAASPNCAGGPLR